MKQVQCTNKTRRAGIRRGNRLAELCSYVFAMLHVVCTTHAQIHCRSIAHPT